MQMPGQERAGTKSQTQCCLTLRMPHYERILTSGPALGPPLYSQLLYEGFSLHPHAKPTEVFTDQKSKKNVEV